MARKRKDSDLGETTFPKKPRTDPASDEPHDIDSLSIRLELSEYTNDGNKRAASEARRAWTYVCQVEGCGQRFNRPCRLEAHMRSHNKERPFACNHYGCDKTFPRKDHLQRHLRSAHAELERNFVCDWEGCDKTFTSRGRLQRHKEVHESKFYCTGFPPCKDVFRKQKTLDAHIKSEHLQTKPYPCHFVDPGTGERCTHGFQTESGLTKHRVKAHEGGKDESHFCMICVPPGTETDTVQNEAGKAVTIPRTPLTFATREELVAHSREVHPPVCSECGVKFKDPQSLKAHVLTIHGDPETRPRFPCPRPGCESVFNRKSNLTVHIQAVHEQQCKFKCTAEAMAQSKHPDLKGWNGENACGLPFKAKNSLEQHIRTHHLGLRNRKETRKMAKAEKKLQPSTLSLLTGVGYDEERQIPCLVKGCDFRFFMDRDLRRHLRATHSLSDAEIDYLVLERDAMTGGQFWIGGLDDLEPMSMFDSTEPSVPQTPMPYNMDSLMEPTGEGFGKGHEQQFGLFDPRLDDTPMLDAEDAEMDAAMGLSHLPPPVDVHDGMHWDISAPVEQ